MTTGRIFLVEDYPVIRKLLKDMIEKTGDFMVIGEASTAREALQKIPRSRADLAVVDVSLPDIHGLRAGRLIKDSCPDIKVVVLLLQPSLLSLYEAEELGVDSLILKEDCSMVLSHTLHLLRSGDYRVMSFQRGTEEANGKACKGTLTPREREVLELIARGFSNKKIALLLELSIKTVESHRTHIMKKLDVHNTAALVSRFLHEFNPDIG